MDPFVKLRTEQIRFFRAVLRGEIGRHNPELQRFAAAAVCGKRRRRGWVGIGPSSVWLDGKEYRAPDNF